MSEPIWPNEVRGEGNGVPWLNKLLRGIKKTWLKDVVFVGGSAKLIPSTDGQTLVLSSVPATSIPPAMFPWKIYNISNFVNLEDNWRTVQMRDGIIGMRSKFVTENPNGGNGFQGNFEIQNYVLNDNASETDQFLTPPAQIQSDVQNILLNNADVQLFGQSTSTGGFINSYAQIMLNDALEDGAVQASFWVDLIENTGLVDYSVNLWGRMYSPSGFSGRPLNPFPDPSPNLVPIATLLAKPDGTFVTQQFATSNLLNRYVNSTLALAQPSVNRGLWDADGLSGQVFYNGDLVVDDTFIETLALNSPSGSFDYYKVYCYIGGANIENTPPSGSPVLWKYVYAYL